MEASADPVPVKGASARRLLVPVKSGPPILTSRSG